MNLESRIISLGILKALGVVVGIILLFWFVFEIQSLILYIGVASVVSLIGRPIVIFLKNKLRVGNTLATVITLLLILTSVGLLLNLFVPIILEQSENLGKIDFDLVKSDINELSIQASDYLGVERIDLFEAIKQTDYVQNFNVELIPSFIDIFFTNFGSFIVGLFATMFIAFFFIKEENLIPNAVTAFAVPGKEKRFISVLYKTRILLSRYFLGLMFQILFLAFFYTIILLIFGVENAIAVALVCAFLNIVPYIGPLVAGALMLLVTFSNNLGADFSSQLLPLLGKVFLGYVIAQLIDNLFIQPFIFGKSVKSHPLEIFVVILIGGLLFGIPGMILAVPVYTAIKVVSKEFLSEYKIVKRLTKNM